MPLSLFKNKYLIAILGFTVWMFCFDERDIITTHFRHPRELRELLLSKKYYEDQIQHTQAELNELKQNDATVEKYAREKFFMKRDNEDLFIIKEAKTQ